MDRSDLIVLFASISAALIWGVSNVYPIRFSVSDLTIQLGTVYIVLMVLPAFAQSSNTFCRSAWGFVAVLVILELPSLNYRANDIAYSPSSTLLVAQVLVAGGYTFAYQRWASVVGGITKSQIVTVSLVSLVIVLFYQISNRLLLAQGVPNEDRSLMLWGLELHHINIGILGLLAVPFVSNNGRLFSLFTILLGVSCGMVWDQWLYFTLNEVTDAAYFKSSTVISGVAAALLIPAFWVTSISGNRSRQLDSKH